LREWEYVFIIKGITKPLRTDQLAYLNATILPGKLAQPPIGKYLRIATNGDFEPNLYYWFQLNASI